MEKREKKAEYNFALQGGVNGSEKRLQINMKIYDSASCNCVMEIHSVHWHDVYVLLYSTVISQAKKMEIAFLN